MTSNDQTYLKRKMENLVLNTFVMQSALFTQDCIQRQTYCAQI